MTTAREVEAHGRPAPLPWHATLGERIANDPLRAAQAARAAGAVAAPGVANLMLTVAFKMLTGDRGKYLGLVLGLTFTSFFMTQQPALFFAILNQVNAFISDVGLADLWVMDPKVQFSRNIIPLSDTMVGRVQGVAGVGWAEPLYVGNAGIRLRDGTFQNTFLIGLDDTTLIGGPPDMVKGRLADLARPDGVIVNADGANGLLARPSLIAGQPPIPLTIGDVFEMNDRRAVVVGISAGGQNENGQPTIFTTYTRAKTYAPSQRKMLSFILVKVKPGFDPTKVVGNISRWTGLAAHTQAEFETLTTRYFIRNQPPFAVFGLSTVVAFVVGGLIAGQIFYNFTLDNLRYFGVMKAMGATNRVLRRMIMVQALTVGAIGYGIGIGAASFFSWFMGRSGRFVPQIPWQLLVVVAVAVLTLCILASVIGLRRIIRLEPAAAFRS
ncbi:MAG TPA: ABC transporter permease [Xanthobacteraceae bacterium]|nr:ABC transporter permease [Xanthobacteraceae bacterium]